MCMRTSQVLPYQRWNWAGDEIVPDPTIPARRPIAGAKRHAAWKLDVRRYLTAPSNSVISEVIREIVKGLSPAQQDHFRSRRETAFDFRRECVVAFFARFRYRKSKGTRRQEAWRLPEETLALEGGDCEDLAFLLATLLEASGISPYCIRVVFGTVTVHGPGTPRVHDHAWVVYLNERGGWEILEPLAFCAQGRATRKRPQAQAPDVEYVPVMVFNHDHLWRVRSYRGEAEIDVDSFLRDRGFWDRFDPSFAAGVHDEIVDEALPRLSWLERQRIKWASFAVDVDTLSYDPRDHFDFAYVEEGWARVAQRLAKRSLGSFALAMHAACDFYAHTVYGEFAPRDAAGRIALYDPKRPFDASGITYDFRPYAPIPGTKRSPEACAELWNGKLISGQWWRDYATFPDDLQYRGDLEVHRSLPDHDFLAVDQKSRRAGVHRYGKEAYAEQFALRRQAAVDHVRKLYAEWNTPRR